MVKKMIIIFFMSLIVFVTFSNNLVLADGEDDATYATINPEDYKPKHLTKASGAARIKYISQTIVGVVHVIGTIASVVTIAILGIKYMFASVEEKAEYKKAMTPYLIGAGMLFGIVNILSIIVNIAYRIFE